jgi:protein SCO1/2
LVLSWLSDTEPNPAEAVSALMQIKAFSDLGGRLSGRVSIGAVPKTILRIATLLCLFLAIASCNRSPNSDDSARFYQVRGIVRGFAPDRSTVDIQHEDIPGFMPSMTMPFSVKDQKDIAGLKIGDAISFRMTVTDKDLLLDQVKKIDAGEVKIVEATSTASAARTAERLREGDIVPFFSLTNQDSRPVTSDSFRGKPYVLTFIFTRCPVPNFCPRMSSNFSELQDAIKSDAALAGKARLLSVTLDPQFDTPEILRGYAAHFKADPEFWMFATGSSGQIDTLTQSFAVFVQPEGGTISHGLATALIAADGSVVKIWRGNDWKPSEIIDELRKL